MRKTRWAVFRAMNMLEPQRPVWQPYLAAEVPAGDAHAHAGQRDADPNDAAARRLDPPGRDGESRS